MQKITLILLLLSFTLHAQKKNNDTRVTPFEFIVYDSDYSMALTLQYILTEDQLKIVSKAELQGEKDTVIYSKHLQPDKALLRLSNLNIDSLKKEYSTLCVRDGSQITVKLTKNGKSKMVHLSNYYQKDIGEAIELINGLTPEKYKIWYDKKELQEFQSNCTMLVE